jgi:hypothetical protein
MNCTAQSIGQDARLTHSDERRDMAATSMLIIAGSEREGSWRRCRDAARRRAGACDAALIVTPEYNGLPTPLVIIAFDWLSRLTADGERPSVS